MWLLVLVLIAVIIYQKINEKNNRLPEEQKKEENGYSKKYEKKEYLLTPTELKFYKALKLVTDELNLVICPQVSMYEIVNNKEYKDFNKISRKSIDFVITEQNLKIKLCIELDDYTHNRQSRIYRDNFVNEVFKATNVKILRIPVQNYYNLEELKNKIKESL